MRRGIANRHLDYGRFAPGHTAIQVCLAYSSGGRDRSRAQPAIAHADGDEGGVHRVPSPFFSAVDSDLDAVDEPDEHLVIQGRILHRETLEQ